MLLVPSFHVNIISDSSSFVKDQLANFGLFFLDNSMNTKICSQCKIEKEITQFNKDKTSKSGYRSYCKSCRSNQYMKNKDHYTAKNLQWRSNNYERHRDYTRKYEKGYIDSMS